jgi:hypothetical protein
VSERGRLCGAPPGAWPSAPAYGRFGSPGMTKRSAAVSLRACVRAVRAPGGPLR